jgi:hypothetical protein
METVIWTFDQEIAPHVSEGLPKSLAHTTSNLLRHVLLRLQFEGPAVSEELTELRILLHKLRDFLDGREGCAELAQRLGAEESETEDIGRLEQLRWRLQDAIEAMHAVRAHCGADDGYRALREEIRDCLDRQLEREALWIERAFTGPRR